MSATLPILALTAGRPPGTDSPNAGTGCGDPRSLVDDITLAAVMAGRK